jgi:hypothetical protein
MTAVAFDTLRFSQRLTEAGLAPPQAAGAAAATAEALGDLVAQLATTHDLAMLRQEMKGEMGELRQEPKGEMSVLREEWKAESAALRREVGGQIEGLRRDMTQLELRMTVKLGTMMAGAIALTAALVKLL